MDDSFDRRGLVSGKIIENEKKSEMFYALPLLFRSLQVTFWEMFIEYNPIPVIIYTNSIIDLVR